MFRQVDEERDSGRKISREDLEHIVDLCNLCGVCPCRDIRSAILAYKTNMIDHRGLAFKVRLIESVERIGRLGGMCPNLANAMLQHKAPRYVMQKLLGIHRERIFPLFPTQSFDGWLRSRRNDIRLKTQVILMGLALRCGSRSLKIHMMSENICGSFTKQMNYIRNSAD
jgi:glycerol-3-phosphate dehydrogenase subunit C